MCIAAKVPLVESGTAGYLGQVQPIIKVGLHSSHLLLIVLFFSQYSSRVIVFAHI